MGTNDLMAHRGRWYTTGPDVPMLSEDSCIPAETLNIFFMLCKSHYNKTMAGLLIFLLFITNLYQLKTASELKIQLNRSDGRLVDVPLLLARTHFDGKALSHCAPVSDSILRTLLPRMISTYGVVIVLNKIECMSCYEFHRDRIRELVTRYSIPVLGLASGDYATLLIRDFPQIVILRYEERQAIQAISNRYTHVILFVDRTGRIVCSDVSDQQSRDVGKMLYSVLRSFLS
jgi:hypothetical protein